MQNCKTKIKKSLEDTEKYVFVFRKSPEIFEKPLETFGNCQKRFQKAFENFIKQSDYKLIILISMVSILPILSIITGEK